jgi:hypothetical protein
MDTLKLPGPPARTLKLEKTTMAAPVSLSRWFATSCIEFWDVALLRWMNSV